MNPIKTHIESNGLRVDAVASSVGVNLATVYRHLKGEKFKLATARKYSLALGIPLEHLLSQVA